jgi:pilus assembly protein CpaC
VQVGGNHFGLDSLLTVLETRGIARTLSQPSLSVLSGEQALFQVGGEVPIQSTETFGNNSVVRVSTEFREFGIQLSVRPLVGEDGTITLDVVPQVVNPDPELTKSIGVATGTPASALAFDSRSLRTSARLQDGQVMVIGGLSSRNTQDKVSRTPWLANIPLIGDLFQGFSNQDTQQELIVVVNPVIVRQPPRNLSLWVFPEHRALLWSPLLTHPVKEPAPETRAPKAGS